MDYGDITLPASDNACSLMGYESYFSDFHSESAVKLGRQFFQSSDHHENLVCGIGIKVLENKEDSRINVLELAKQFESQVAFTKEGDKSAEEERQSVEEAEQDDFPGLSPLRGDCVLNSSIIDTGVEEEYLTRIFDDGTGCTDCENFLFSSTPNVDGNWSKQRDRFSPQPPSNDCIVDLYCNSMEGENESLSKKSKDDGQLFSLQSGGGLPLQFQFAEKMKDSLQFNHFSCSHEQHVEEVILGSQYVEHEVSLSAQGSTSEPTYCSSKERCTSEKPSQLSTSFACSSIGTAENTMDKGTFDSCKRTSNCTNVKMVRENLITNSSSTAIVRRTNPKRAASLRSNLADNKSNSLIPIQIDRRRRWRKVRASTSRAPFTLKMFSEVRRKIRNSHRHARLSVWGTAENLFNIIKQRNEILKHDLESNAATKRRSKKAGHGVNREKRSTLLKNKLSRSSSNKISSLSSQSTAPIMFDNDASLENGTEHFMAISDGHTASETSSTKTELKKNLVENWYAGVRSSMREGQHGEKDLESTLTQEIFADNLLFECHGVSSRIDLNFVAEISDNKQPSNSGNSPDSDVYNPLIDVGIVPVEGSALFKQESLSDRYNQSQEPKVEEILPFLEKQVLDHEILRTNPEKSRKGKKNKKVKKGKKTSRANESPFLLLNPCVEERLDCLGNSDEVKKALPGNNFHFKDKEIFDLGVPCSKSAGKHCKRGTKSEMFLIDSSFSGLTDLNTSNHCLEMKNRMEGTRCFLQNDNNEQLESFLPSDFVEESQIHRIAEQRLFKNKSNCVYSIRRRKNGQQKGIIPKSDKVMISSVLPKENDNLECSPGITNKLTLPGDQMQGEKAAIDALPKDESNDFAALAGSQLSARELYSALLGSSSLSGKKAWALCDDCQKWRCVPDELVHVIEKSQWTCKDNVDEKFADCRIPQEKTDDEINKDLGIFDEYFSATPCSQGELAPMKLSAAAQTTWTRIKSNFFLHRNRRTLTIDEIMVCHCKPPQDGSMGCVEECLNRMLNIECVKGTCPCGNLCSNQEFQKRKYAKFKWIKCGKKGYGLQLEENASRGQFLIEYVGEVLDLAAYEARLRYYAGRGQKHFYFMTLNGGEVIDACTKGNLGRYINHSCDPNCRTEKWMVNGEVCIGLFALRDIKKGEEITFDYNYVRVFGAAAKKCICGSADCRGYIGGDPSSSEIVVQDDSDAEDLEPVMIEEDGFVEQSVAGIDSDATDAKAIGHENIVEKNEMKGDYIENQCLENQISVPDLTDSLIKSSNCADSENNSCKISDDNPFNDLRLDLSSIEPDHTSCEDANESPPLRSAFGLFPESSEQSNHAVHELALIGTMKKSSSATYPIEEILTASKPDNAAKASQHVKIKRSRVNIKGAVSGKTKKVSTAISSRHMERVEEKLNELIDEDGGINRQKPDAAKGYLKLLVVTAAAGDETRGSMSQSTRDLSLILDAILKTKSRMVLVDIINKNGLQMLHNIMKQNCENFNRIPIIRKLLKVLEFLAEKEILTSDHINAAPPCSRMESFKESMLKLKKHRDSQVQLIARNFANQWISRTIRRLEPFERDGRHSCTQHSHHNRCHTWKFNSRNDHGICDASGVLSGNASNSLPCSEVDIHGDPVSLPSQQVSSSTSFTDNGPIEMLRPRKRKSRWDQPSDTTIPCEQTPPIEHIEISKQILEKLTEGNNSSSAISTVQDSLQQNKEGVDDDGDDELPPGFESSCIEECAQPANTTTDIVGEVVIAFPLERYLAHLPVSYGMPVDLMRELGTLETKHGNHLDSSWKIAPAIPFKPFPPLPSYPRPDPFSLNTQNHQNFSSFHAKEDARRHGNERRFFKAQQWSNRRR